MQRQLVTWCAILVLIGATTAQAQSTDALAEAYRLEGAGRYRKAQSTYVSLADAEKTPGLATLRLIRLYRLRGKDADATKRLTAALGALKGKAAAPFHVEAGELALEGGRLAEARAAFDKALAAEPGRIEAVVGLGLADLEEGKEKAGLKRFMKLFDQYDPNSTDYDGRSLTYHAIAFRHLAMRSDEIARSDTLRTIINDIVPEALKKDPHCQTATFVRGELLLDAFHTPEAKRGFEKALKTNPHHPLLRLGLGLTYAQRYSTLKQAPKELTKALDGNPRLAAAHETLAALYLKDELYEKAKKHLDKALKINPRRLSALALRGGYHLLRREQAEYEAVEKQVMGLNPHYGAFYLVAAEALETKRQFEKGAALCKKATEVDPRLWHAWIALGKNLLRIGKEDEAKKALEIVKKEFFYHVQSRNFLLLLDSYNEYVVQNSEHFRIRLHVKENTVMRPLVTEFMERAHRVLSRRYGHTPEGPLLFEMFKDHNDFAVRTLGLPGLGALGACFGKVVTMDSPKAFGRPFNWAATAWHEFAHVITLQQSGMQVPRWFTEGLSEYEEFVYNPSWVRPLHMSLYAAWTRGQMHGLGTLNAGFTRPRYRNEIGVCYFQGGLLCRFIAETFGFERIPQMLKLYAQGKKTPEVVKTALGLTIKEFDAQSLAFLKKEIFDKIHVLPGFSADKLEDLKDELEDEPDDLDIRLQVALAYLSNGKASDAELKAGQVLQRNPKSAQAHLILGRINYGRRNYEKARGHFEQALALGARDYHARLMLGLIFKNVDKDAGKAAASWEASIKENPFVGQPWTLLAAHYKQTGDLASWARCTEGIVARGNALIKPRVELVNYFRDAGQQAKVAKYVTEVLEIDPFQPEMQLYKGQALLAEKRFTEALVPLKVAVELKPKEGMHRILTALGEAHYGLKDYKKAELLVREALSLKPNYKKAQRLLEKLR